MLLGAAFWVAAWVLIAQTQDGSVAVLGLSERGWRRSLDPSTLMLMTGLLGFHAANRQRYGRLGLAAFAIAEFGFALVLIGNVIEFWIGGLLYAEVPGGFVPTDHIGWAVFLVGLLVVFAGLTLMGVAFWRGGSGRSESSLA